jgi:hypothetical protein
MEFSAYLYIVYLPPGFHKQAVRPMLCFAKAVRLHSVVNAALFYGYLPKFTSRILFDLLESFM